MLAPEEVMAMVRLQGLGWGTKRIARELGCDRKTVKRYLRRGGWQAYRQPQRATALDGLDGWLAGSGAIGAMPTWCARNWPGSMASRYRCAPWSGR